MLLQQMKPGDSNFSQYTVVLVTTETCNVVPGVYSFKNDSESLRSHVPNVELQPTQNIAMLIYQLDI